MIKKKKKKTSRVPDAFSRLLVDTTLSSVYVALQLPGFFLKNHDYGMYSNNVEFINDLLNMKTRYSMEFLNLIGQKALIHIWINSSSDRFVLICYYFYSKA